MALTRNEMDRKMDEHFGFEAADNIEGVLSTLASDVVAPWHRREDGVGTLNTLGAVRVA